MRRGRAKLGEYHDAARLVLRGETDAEKAVRVRKPRVSMQPSWRSIADDQLTRRRRGAQLYSAFARQFTIQSPRYSTTLKIKTGM